MHVLRNVLNVDPRNIEIQAEHCFEDLDINSKGEVSYEQFFLNWKYKKQ